MHSQDGIQIYPGEREKSVYIIQKHAFVHLSQHKHLTVILSYTTLPKASACRAISYEIFVLRGMLVDIYHEPLE